MNRLIEGYPALYTNIMPLLHAPQQCEELAGKEEEVARDEKELAGKEEELARDAEGLS